MIDTLTYAPPHRHAAAARWCVRASSAIAAFLLLAPPIWLFLSSLGEGVLAMRSDVPISLVNLMYRFIMWPLGMMLVASLSGLLLALAGCWAGAGLRQSAFALLANAVMTLVTLLVALA